MSEKLKLLKKDLDKFGLLQDNLEELDIKLTKSNLKCDVKSPKSAVAQNRKENVLNKIRENNMNTDQEIEGLREHCMEVRALCGEAFGLPESEGTKMANDARARYSKPVDVSVRLMEGDINLLKSAILQPPTNPAEKKYMLDLQKLTEKELAAHLVKIAVRKFVADYAMSKINPSV